MNNILNKSTFYDMVSMIIPGFITIFFTSVMFDFKCIFYNEKLWFPIYVCVFTVSYLIGLLIHYYSKNKFDSITKNDPSKIQEAKNKLEEVLKKPHLKEYYEAYYKVINTTPIPILEAQVSFIRSMIVVLCILSCIAIASLIYYLFFQIPILKNFFINTIFPDNRIIILSIGVIILRLIFYKKLKKLMIKIQEAIYFRVFEDGNYMCNEK